MENNNSYAKQFRQALNERIVIFNKDSDADSSRDSKKDFISYLLEELNIPDDYEKNDKRIEFRFMLGDFLDGKDIPYDKNRFIDAFYKALEHFPRRITPVSSDTVCADNEKSNESFDVITFK